MRTPLWVCADTDTTMLFLRQLTALGHDQKCTHLCIHEGVQRVWVKEPPCCITLQGDYARFTKLPAADIP